MPQPLLHLNTIFYFLVSTISNKVQRTYIGLKSYTMIYSAVSCQLWLATCNSRCGSLVTPHTEWNSICINACYGSIFLYEVMQATLGFCHHNSDAYLPLNSLGKLSTDLGERYDSMVSYISAITSKKKKI